MTTKKGKTMMPCDAIEATTATQVRTELNRSVIELYQEDIEQGAEMPPVVVFRENGSERVILADGFHRLLAHINADILEIQVDIHEGGMHEALAYALQANRTHGLRRTPSDKVNAVKLALKDPIFRDLTQQEIADLCGVSRKTVSRISVRNTIDEPEVQGKKVKPKKPSPDDVRPTKQPPTQAEVELAELRQALALIKALAYDGDTAAQTLELSKDDTADLEYVSTWCAHAVFTARGGE
jgi:ParB-like chromosome segregation protein Spo0J